jgi:hypothetical protein
MAERGAAVSDTVPSKRSRAKQADAKANTTASAWLSGGTAGQSFTVTNRITTTGGRTEDRSFTIRVEER